MRIVRNASSLLITFAGMLAMMACGGGQREESSPTACIRAMSLFSREGRVEEYLDCFAGELRAKLELARKEMKPGEFADALRRRAAPVRGFAISEHTPVDDATARLRVEWVFEDRNEIQTVTLRKVQGAWKIAEMSDAQYSKPAVPYGTKVFE